MRLLLLLYHQYWARLLADPYFLITVYLVWKVRAIFFADRLIDLDAFFDSVHERLTIACFSLIKLRASSSGEKALFFTLECSLKSPSFRYHAWTRLKVSRIFYLWSRRALSGTSRCPPRCMNFADSFPNTRWKLLSHLQPVEGYNANVLIVIIIDSSNTIFSVHKEKKNVFFFNRLTQGVHCLVLPL